MKSAKENKICCGTEFAQMRKETSCQNMSQKKKYFDSQIRESTQSADTLIIFCCVRNSMPINMNFWAGIKSDFSRFQMKPRLCTTLRQYIV